MQARMGTTQQRYAMLHRNVRDTPGANCSRSSPKNGLHISPRTHFLGPTHTPDTPQDWNAVEGRTEMNPKLCQGRADEKSQCLTSNPSSYATLRSFVALYPTLAEKVVRIRISRVRRSRNVNSMFDAWTEILCHADFPVLNPPEQRATHLNRAGYMT
jgi:hypothetical protein